MELRDWSFREVRKDRYTPPELARLVVCGTVSGDPNLADGTEAMAEYTSVNGREVTLNTGEIAVLVGEPEEGYAAFCKESGIDPVPTKKG